ncbi:hypothetical protein [Furfurilactobacillus curtus]|uniref:Bacteriocin immunity protein n=1 Tax=Furfurilactobacillus curtus TaxID=1746200 RepID=A0ABQ5JTE8_9LACO
MDKELLSQLKQLHFKKQNEQKIIDAGINELNSGAYEGRVIKDLQQSFGKLALSKNISAEALALYTALQKPNIGHDVGLNIGTWV